MANELVEQLYPNMVGDPVPNTVSITVATGANTYEERWTILLENIKEISEEIAIQAVNQLAQEPPVVVELGTLNKLFLLQHTLLQILPAIGVEVVAE